MGSVFSFVEDFLPAQQFAGLLALLDTKYPEADLRRRLGEDRVTLFLPADSGLVPAARQFGFGGARAADALRFLISESAIQLEIPSLTAMLRFVLSHVAPGCHATPGAASGKTGPGRLPLLCGEGAEFTAAGVVAQAPDRRANLLIADRICDNGVVHVIASPLLPARLRPRAGEARRHPARAAPPPAAPSAVPSAVPDRAAPEAGMQMPPAQGSRSIGWSPRYVIGATHQDRACLTRPAAAPPDALPGSPRAERPPDTLPAAAIHGLNLLRQALTNPEHDRFRFDFEGKD
ncbi:MAG TPA: hypothetical protein VGA75_02340 [Paracoccaceae bacterium]